MNIYDLDSKLLNSLAKSALYVEGIKTLSQLKERWKQGELRRISGLGAKSINQIERLFGTDGLSKREYELYNFLKSKIKTGDDHIPLKQLVKNTIDYIKHTNESQLTLEVLDLIKFFK